MFVEAKSAEIKSWFDNEVFDLVDIRKFKTKNFVTSRWVLTVKRDRDGKFQKCKARWVLRGFQDRQKDAQQTDSPTSTRPGLRLLCQNAASNGWSTRHIDLKTAFLQGESYAPDRDVVCQLPLEAGKPWYLATRLKKPAYGMNDAPRKWGNRLDSAVKAMGLLPARADRCTYVSYADVKKKTKQVVHATGDNEATQSFEQTGHLLNEDNYNEVYENILQQLMETDESRGLPDAAYKNNADGSSQRGQCIFICQPRSKERDTRGSLIDYESHKIKRTVLSTTVAELYAVMKCYGSAQFYRGLWMDMTAQPIEVHLRTDANNLIMTAASTRLPEQKETIHMIQMLRQEACSGQKHDLAHVLTQYCLADPLTKKSVSAALLISTVQTGILREVDTHPPFKSTVQHKAFITENIYSDVEATQDYWGHLMCHPVYHKIQKDTMVSAPSEMGGKSHFVSKGSLTGRCFVSATGPDGTRTTSTTPEKPMPSLEGLTGYIVFETHGGSRLSDYWQQKPKTRLSRVHVTPRKTLFTPSQAPVDFSLLSPSRTTRKSYLNGSTQTLCDTWLANVKGSGYGRVGRRDSL